ncbi:hypothetical protein K492DRAFT_161126 [Lichtheimia hyalospora FSU 10163]|nr:hypothetical protein K492DRAFT_161126 [Lichtheimia hyalospora FSU 10163]
MLLVHRIGCTSRLLSVAHYSTKQIPKKAAGAFTSNKYITQPVAGSIANKTLVYIGPFADTMQRYKMVASLFGACGLCAVPALLSTGQPSILSVILAGTSAMAPALFIHWYTRNIATKLIVYDDVKTVEQQRRRPREINTGKWIGIETSSLLGRLRENNMWLSDLTSTHGDKVITWQSSKRRYVFERAVMEADPYLQGLDQCISGKKSHGNVNK